MGETTTLTGIGDCSPDKQCLVMFKINQYSKRDSTLGASNAKVTLYNTQGIYAKYTVPSDIGIADDYWLTVFTLDAHQGIAYQGERSLAPAVDHNTTTCNWGTSFDWNYWNVGPVEGFLQDLHRVGGALHQIDSASFHKISHAGGPLICEDHDWTGKLENEGWAGCPQGSYLNGFYREGNRYAPGQGVSQISKGKCCRAPNAPADEWGSCAKFPAWTTGCGVVDGLDTVMVGLHRNKADENATTSDIN